MTDAAENGPRPREGLWAAAGRLAGSTPASRNRYVDLLRAVSIAAVVTGHWLVAAPVYRAGAIEPGHILTLVPWSRWLTWGFQVMPVFFIVGGFSNAMSWRAARRKGTDPAVWLAGRLRRLVVPLLPLVLAWAVLAAAALAGGVSPATVRVGSRMALIPIWFLAVYVLVVLFVPVTYAAWERFGKASFWVPAVAAAGIDAAFFALDLRWLGWSNYLFVWIAVHQIGYAWRDGSLTGTARRALLAAGGAAVLVTAVFAGPYPLAMVGVPGEEISNTRPPKIPMIALGALQAGLLLSFERPARRWLARAVPWTLTVLVNGMIMTVYLWHLTAMALLIGLAWALGGVGLTLAPGSGAWWASRPLWLCVLGVVMVPFVAGLSRFERAGGDGRAVAAWRLIAGGAVLTAGLALLALGGVAGPDWPYLRVGVLALPFLGAALMGILPWRPRAAPRSVQ